MATEIATTDKPILPPPTLAQYPELILGAIEAADDNNGASTEAISKHIESMYGELPAAHSTLLSHHLNKMKQNGDLVMYKENYCKPDPTRSAVRGRGRPPKAKISPAAGDAVSTPRPRGRPKKVVEPGSEVKLSESRPRGRPKKIVEPGSEVKLSESRPRGRPKKSVEPGSEVKLSGSRPRGRPPKSGGSVAALRVHRPRGRPAKALALAFKRRGRPRKNADAKTPMARPRGRPVGSGGAVQLSRPRGRPPKKADAKAPKTPSMSSRPRGRPPKNVASEGVVAPPKENVGLDGPSMIEGPVALPVKNSSPSLSGKKRGRPKKIEESGDHTADLSTPQPGVKRGRGRPAKATPA